MRILVFGNSGSGKSTLAGRVALDLRGFHLDLDTIAWKDDEPGIREDEFVSIQKLDSFMRANEKWVIEGCYSSLLAEAARQASLLIFLNPGIETCLQNCRSRPWEEHKYSSKEEQDRNLEVLMNWVREYETRDDEFSLAEHQRIFDSFDGKKMEIKSNEEASRIRLQ